MKNVFKTSLQLIQKIKKSRETPKNALNSSPDQIFFNLKTSTPTAHRSGVSVAVSTFRGAAKPVVEGGSVARSGVRRV